MHCHGMKYKKRITASWRYTWILNPIKKASNTRIACKSGFNLIRSNAEWFAKQNDKQYPLSLKKYLDEQKAD